MKQTISLLKSYLYVFFWIAYFWFAHFYSNHQIFQVINEKPYWDIGLSYFNAIFWFFTLLWALNVSIRILDKVFWKISARTETQLDEVLWEFIIKFLNITKYIAAGYIFFTLAATWKYVDILVNQITSVLVIIVFLILLTSFVNVVFEKELILKSKLKAVSKTLLPFINKIIVIFIWVIWAISIIWNLGYDVSALVAWAWIWGLAVALAAQKSITNVFWAITILLNRPFKIWDFININWHIWTVKDIGLSYLTITDQAGHQVMIPNENIISSSIENYSVRQNRKTFYSIWLVYGTTLDKMKEGVKIIEEILEVYKTENGISSYRVNFDAFNAFSLDIQVTYFSLVNKNYVEYLKQKEEINLKIKEQFEKAGLDMAFPTQELILKKED